MFVYIRLAAFIIVVTQKLLLQQPKYVTLTAKCTETLLPPPCIQFSLHIRTMYISGCQGSVYKVHPERVHILPPPEVTRMRTLPRPGSAKCRTTKQKIREPSPIRKLPLPEIFYNNPELEEKAELTDRLVTIMKIIKMHGTFRFFILTLLTLRSIMTIQHFVKLNIDGT